MQRGSIVAELRGAQMSAGRAQARNRKMQAHQKQVLLEHTRRLKVQGAMRAGTEVVVRDTTRNGGKRRSGGQNLKLVCRRPRTRGKGKYQSIGTQCRLEMAFHVEQKHKTLARMFGLGPKAVALSRISIAEIFMRSQYSWLMHLVNFAKQEKPAVVITQRKWDETRHLLTTSATGTPVRDHIEIMVSSIRLVLRWQSGRILVMDVVAPPCPLLTPSASNISAALHGHPLLVKIVAALKELRASGKTRISLSEFDGAAGNDKLYSAHSRHEDFKEDGTMMEFCLCGNHQQHLVSLGVLNVLALEITNTTILSGYFLSFNGHWSRLVACTSEVVNRKLKISYDAPPEGAEDYRTEIAQFLLRNERMDIDPDDDDDTQNRRHIQHQLFEALESFMAIFNGEWWRHGDGSWVHFCRRDGACCGKFGDSDEARAEIAKDKAVRSIRQVLFRRRPGKAAANKWTKLAPPFLFFVMGAAAHDMLRVICQEALQSVKVVYEKALAEEPGHIHMK